MNDTMTLLPHIKFQFNIDYPTWEESYTYGYECAINDIPEEDNPYAEKTQESKAWLEGWWAGFYGEEPLFNLVDTAVESASIDNSANDPSYPHFPESFIHAHPGLIGSVIKITTALTATLIAGYQLFDLVA